MEFDMNVFDCFVNQALLGVGDKEHFNAMTGVGFKEAKKTLVCRKLYKQTLDTNLMPQDIVEKHYPNGDVHDMYIAEVLEIIE